MRASYSTLTRLVFLLWPVPFALGIARRFAGTWSGYAAYAIAAALVLAALGTLWSATRPRA